MIRKFLIFSVLIVLLGSCGVLRVSVPPESMAKESAIKVVANDYELIDMFKESDYLEIPFDGMVGVFKKDGDTFFLHVYKGEDSKSAKNVWKKIADKLGMFWWRTILELPWSGRVSTKKDGKEIVCWWRNRWVFVAEGMKKTDEFVDHIMNTYNFYK